MEKTAGRRVEQRRRGKQKTALGEREKRRLAQLAACVALFLVVFLAKGTGRLAGFRAELASALGTDADFQAAFADLGWSVASGQPVGKTVNGLLSDVFLPQAGTTTQGGDGPLRETALRCLNQSETAPARALVEMPAESGPADPMAGSASRSAPQEEPAVEAEPEVIHMDYTGPTLPDNTTMDRYALHLEETVTPAMGALSSGFGWRDHPIEGEEKFHYGVDLAVDTGTPVLAFAAGTVDYIGESDIYGQYLQIDHGNGVKTFYAHCSKLCVQQGQTVMAGAKVAESGDTGETTGPHLHFELKRDGVRLNPLYYIQIETAS